MDNVLNSQEACEFLVRKGIPMSKSKLYKLTASYKIVFHRVQSRLIFYEEDLKQYADKQISTPDCFTNSHINQIVQSAQNKLNSNF